MYSPRIPPELVRILYKYKQCLDVKVPMTRIVKEAIELYLEDKTKPAKDKKG